MSTASLSVWGITYVYVLSLTMLALLKPAFESDPLSEAKQSLSTEKTFRDPDSN